MAIFQEPLVSEVSWKNNKTHAKLFFRGSRKRVGLLPALWQVALIDRRWRTLSAENGQSQPRASKTPRESNFPFNSYSEGQISRRPMKIPLSNSYSVGTSRGPLKLLLFDSYSKRISKLFLSLFNSYSEGRIWRRPMKLPLFNSYSVWTSRWPSKLFLLLNSY